LCSCCGSRCRTERATWASCNLAEFLHIWGTETSPRRRSSSSSRLMANSTTSTTRSTSILQRLGTRSNSSLTARRGGLVSRGSRRWPTLGLAPSLSHVGWRFLPWTAGVRVHVTAVGLRDHPHAEWVLARAVRGAEVAASQSRPAWGPACGGGCYCGVCRREQPHSSPSTLSSCRRCVRRVLSRMSPPRVLQPTLLLPVTWALAAARSPMLTQSSRTKFWKPG